MSLSIHYGDQLFAPNYMKNNEDQISYILLHVIYSTDKTAFFLSDKEVGILMIGAICV